MTKYLSDQNKIVMIHESGTYATTSGGGVWIGLVQENTINENTNVNPIRYQGSTDRNVDVFTDGVLGYTGTLTYYPQDFRLLGYTIGSVVDSLGTHVITENNGDDRVQTMNQPLTSFTMEDSKTSTTTDNNFIRTVKGTMVDSYTLTFTQGEPVSCEIGYVAQDVTFSSGTSTSVTVNGSRPYLWSDAQFHLPSGTVVNNVTEMTLTVNNNLATGQYINGSRVAYEFLPQNRDYELALTLYLDNTNAKTLYYQYFLGGSEFNCMIKAQGTPGSAFIVMSGCKITDMEAPSPVEGINEQTITVQPKSLSASITDAISKYNAW
jgi:hypothetical protein